MAEFPTTPRPSYPVIIEPEWKTNISTFDSGKEQRRQKWDYPKYNVELTYNVLSSANIQVLWDFYMARKGASEAFYFYDLESVAHNAQYVGQGDGAIVTFDIPGKSTSSQVIYIDGVPQGSGYTILTGGGSENSDRVQFTAPPAAGGMISCDFTGFLRIRCRFEKDKMSKTAFTASLRQTGLKLKGLSFA